MTDSRLVRGKPSWEELDALYAKAVETVAALTQRLSEVEAEREKAEERVLDGERWITSLREELASLRADQERMREALEQKFNEEQVGQWLSAFETGATAKQRRDAYYSLRAYFEPMRDALAALSTPRQP